MELRLKNVERVFAVNSPTERRMKSSDKYCWVVAFQIQEPLTTDEVDMYFVPENIAEMTFVTSLVNGATYEYSLVGYSEKIFGVIRHAEDGSCVVELQFSKEA